MSGTEVSPATAAGRYIGQSVRRREDPRLLTGRGRYVDDVVVPGVLHAAFVRSTVAHGRLHGGSYEEMVEQATRAYLAEYLAGTDVILTASELRECADLSRRVQGYLLDWGQLQSGRDADLREGCPRLRW